MTAATDTTAVLGVWRRIEQIQSVATTFPAADTRRQVLDEVITGQLQDLAPVRPTIAARVLGLTEKTVRAWTSEGVLRATSHEPRLLLDPESLHRVWMLVRDLRAAGQTRGLLDAVYRRLQDLAVLDDPRLQESLGQMRRGEGTVLVTREQATANSANANAAAARLVAATA